MARVGDPHLPHFLIDGVPVVLYCVHTLLLRCCHQAASGRVLSTALLRLRLVTSRGPPYPPPPRAHPSDWTWTKLQSRDRTPPLLLVSYTASLAARHDFELLLGGTAARFYQSLDTAQRSASLSFYRTLWKFTCLPWHFAERRWAAVRPTWRLGPIKSVNLRNAFALGIALTIPYLLLTSHYLSRPPPPPDLATVHATINSARRCSPSTAPRSSRQ